MPQNVKFGKNPPRFDPRTPFLHNHLTGPQLSYPAKQDWISAGKVGYWGMMLNDTLGDCVIASKGHLVIEYTTLTGNHNTVVLPDSVILAGYEAVGGYVPGNPSTDNGCDMLTAAQYFRATGFGGHRISAYASVAPTNLDMVYAAINLFGACDIGFNVPQSAMAQFDAGQPWDVTSDDGQILGGHDVPLMAYDSVGKMFTCITWGRPQLMTQAFFAKYCDEAFTYLSPDWISGGLAPNKFNLAQLTADISGLNSKAMPSVNWSSLITWITMLLHTYGPSAVPLVNALIAALPLTPAQVLIIQTLIDEVLNEAKK